MKIIKRKGHIETFDIEKIKQSLSSASADINEPLSESDLKLISKKVENKLQEMNRETTSSYEVFSLVLFVLKDMDFNKLGQAYCNGSLHFS